MREEDSTVAKAAQRIAVAGFQFQKLPGQAIGVNGSFHHTGPAETITVSWYIAKAQLLGHADFPDWIMIPPANGSYVIAQTEDIVSKTYPFSIGGVMPTPDGVRVRMDWDYDCVLRIYRPGGIVGAEAWFDDIYAYNYVQVYDMLTASFR